MVCCVLFYSSLPHYPAVRDTQRQRETDTESERDREGIWSLWGDDHGVGGGGSALSLRGSGRGLQYSAWLQKHLHPAGGASGGQERENGRGHEKGEGDAERV